MKNEIGKPILVSLLLFSFCTHRSLAESANGWKYWESRDEMRDQVVRFAELENNGYILQIVEKAKLA
jgi:hypothetical protein